MWGGEKGAHREVGLWVCVARPATFSTMSPERVPAFLHPGERRRRGLPVGGGSPINFEAPYHWGAVKEPPRRGSGTQESEVRVRGRPWDPKCLIFAARGWHEIY